MLQEDYDNFKKLPFEVVNDIIGTQYIFENGEAKTIEIMKKLANSQKVTDLSMRMRVAGDIVSPNDLLYFVNGLSFFLFSKSETVCIAAISIAMFRFKEYGELTTNTMNGDIVGYLMEIVNRCERMKFNKSDTFYTRVYGKLLQEYNHSQSYL